MANEKRLIDAYALAEQIHKSKHDNPHTDSKVARNHTFEHEHFARMVCCAPTVDAVEVVHGRWIDAREYCGDYMCSNCDALYGTNKFNYCPNCGAKMEPPKGE